MKRVDSERGLYGKYDIYKHETGEEVKGPAFVLRPDRDEAARLAIRFYAIFTENEALASDLRQWMNEIEVEKRLT